MLGFRLLVAAVPAAVDHDPILLVYVGTDGTAKDAAEMDSHTAAFAAALESATRHHVVRVPIQTRTPEDRARAVRTFVARCSAERPPVVVAWSRAAWVVETAAIDGASIRAIVSVGGIHDLGGPMHSRVAANLIGREVATSPLHRNCSRMPPLLLIHSPRDRYVPPSQSVALCNHLRAGGRVVRLVCPSECGHVPWSAAEGKFYSLLICDWLSSVRASKPDPSDDALLL